MKQWTPSGGTSTLNSQFNNLGNIILSGGTIIATDRDDNTVWMVNTNSGKRTLLFGSCAVASVASASAICSSISVVSNCANSCPRVT
ncbi:MAG TPA: hypothetical protein VGN61_14455 [Verrucomicrobiae bacterium]